MDPVSAAGLGLSAASLAFQLFAGCVKGFVLISTAENLGKDSSTLVCMLHLEEAQLVEWAIRAGLLPVDEDIYGRLNGLAVERTLKELQTLMLDTENLRQRYKLDMQVSSSNAHNGDESVMGMTTALAEGLISHSISNNLRKDIMERAKVVNSRSGWPKRMWWAAVDRDKLEALVMNIHRLVSGLWTLLDSVRQDMMMASIQNMLSHVVGVNEKVEQLLSLPATLQRVSLPAVVGRQTNEENAAIATAAQIKATRLQLHEDDDWATKPLNKPADSRLAPSPPAILSIRLLNDFRPQLGTPEMGTASYMGEQVFVEWKDIPTQNRSKIVKRAENLATLLSLSDNSMGTLCCKGLARDNDASKLAFVYHLPSSYGKSLSIRTLRTSYWSRPSVSDRLQIALALMKMVKGLHTAGWLHKSIRSENVLLLNPPTGDNDIGNSIGAPMLAGFMFSRVDSPTEISEHPSTNPHRDIYRHPDAMGDPSVDFDRLKDIYALGTVLLEIGEWSSLRSIVEKKVNLNQATVTLQNLSMIRPFLLDEGDGGCLATLKYRMGNVYTAVTLMCLSGVVPWTLDQERPTWRHREELDLLEIATRALSQCRI